MCLVTHSYVRCLFLGRASEERRAGSICFPRGVEIGACPEVGTLGVFDVSLSSHAQLVRDTREVVFTLETRSHFLDVGVKILH